MQFLFALAVVLAYLSGDPALAQCLGVSSFSAYTFDVLNYVPSRSYHAVPEGLTLYENAVDGGETLFDFNTGTIYIRNTDGSCFKYHSSDLAVSLVHVQYLVLEEIKNKHKSLSSTLTGSKESSSFVFYMRGL